MAHTIGYRGRLIGRTLACLAAVFTSTLYAQGPFGRITGRVTDNAQAVVVGAKVQAVQVETNVVTSTVSNVEGNFELLNLGSGRYRLVVELEGFKRFERGPLEVRLGDVLNIPVTLDLGTLAESVTVTAQAPLLESATASLGQVVEHRTLTDLAFPAANPMYLTQLTAGVVSSAPLGFAWLPQAVNMISDSVAGTAAKSSEFMLDGMPNMTTNGQPAFIPMPEMLQEMRVQTAPFDASVGHFSGGSINMVFKSGTNLFHGDAVFMHTSRPLSTKPFFTNKSLYDLAGGPVTKEKVDRLFPGVLTNTYRASVSGPVYIPKLYDGRNRTFWTWGFSMVDRGMPGSSYYTIPTDAERQGDFSALLGVSSRYQIYDPNTIALAPEGRFSRQPFAGNIIPSSRLDPMAQKLLAYYPNHPNTVGTIDGQKNYFDSPRTKIDYHAIIFRVDHMFGQNDRSYVSYAKHYNNELHRNTFPMEQGGTTLMQRPGFALAIDHVHTVGSNSVLDIRYGVNRMIWDLGPPGRGFDITKVGYPQSLAATIDSAHAFLPIFAITGYTQLGRDSGTVAPNTYHALFATVSHVLGAHTLRYGGEFRSLQQNLLDYGVVAPGQQFDTTWTRGPLDSSPAAPIGQGLASFLLGRASGGYIDRNAARAAQSNYFAGFVADDWKITRKLTLNIGLRYELETPITERYDRIVRGFDFNTPNPITDTVSRNYALKPIPEISPQDFSVRGGLLFAGVGGQPRGIRDTDANNFLPRFGLAYLLREKTVFRGGYGIFFESLGADRVSSVPQHGFSARTSVVPSTDNGLTFRTSMRDPLPEGILEPTGASLGLETFLGRSPDVFWPARKAGYMQRWSLNIQHEFPTRVLLEVGYMGNRGTGLGVHESLNFVPSQYLSKSPVRDQATINYLSQAVPNPFNGLPQFAGTGLQGGTVSRAQLLMQYPQFLSFGSTISEGLSWYHALQVRVEKRLSHGYTIQAAYTWSKTMQATSKLNPSDTALDHVISNLDRQHHLAVSGIYELPFGAGKPFLSRSPGWLNQVVGGWTVSAVYQAQSGPPIQFGNVIFTGSLSDIVLPRSERRVERWFNTDAGFEHDPAKQLASNIRTFPQRLTGLRADGINNWDMSVYKAFGISEKLKFQLRATAQDALNHAMFAAPNTNPASTLFGVVTSTVWGEQRKIAVGGKLSW